MAQVKPTKSTEFDTVIIGAGLSGLILAQQLSTTGRDVALIEEREYVGGNSRPMNSPLGPVDHGLKLFPERTEASSLLTWFESVLGQRLDAHLIEVPPVTFDNGRFQPFVGFGAETVNTSHEISWYATARRFETALTPKDWVLHLQQGFTGTLLTQSIITKLDVEDGRVTGLWLNGTKRVVAKEVIFCASPRQLARLLPEATVPAKWRQKLTKGAYWTSVCSDLVHSMTVTESAAAHILRGGQDEPCVGVFHAPRATEDGRVLQLSQWVTFIPSDQTEDNETVATTLRHIKRQIKRAYPTALDGLIHERILVVPDSHGDSGLRPEGDRKWPKIDNLWVCSDLLSDEKNTWGSLVEAKAILEQFDAPILNAIAADAPSTL